MCLIFDFVTPQVKIKFKATLLNLGWLEEYKLNHFFVKISRFRCCHCLKKLFFDNLTFTA